MVAALVIAAVAALLAVIVVRGLRVKPATVDDPLPPTSVRGSDEAVERFRDMLRIPTVWDRENPDADREPFDRFVPRMRELYPHVFSQLELEMINTYGILLKWEGSNPALDPVVLMAHHDVVSADPRGWTHDPFGADVEDGRIWARGAVDTKCLLAGLYEAAEMLLGEGFAPVRTIYLWSSNCEEDNGDTTPILVETFKRRGIEPAFVLDEGGAVIDNAPLNVKNEFAVIGLAEKGLFNADITVSSEGGHASTPSLSDSTARLVTGLERLQRNPGAARMSAPLEAMLRELAAHSGLPYRIVFGNLWLFRPLVVRMLEGNPETAAMLRTTYALTELEGSPSANVIPKQARANVNVRVDPAESVREARARIEAAFEGEADVCLFDAIEPSRIAPWRGDRAWNFLCAVVRSAYPEAGIAPYIQVSCSDARHFQREFQRVYRFAGMLFRGDQRSRIHGQDESIDVESFKRGVGFYYELMRNIDRLGG
ncbi:MAG: M20/M25/M40 family metallo-hydrolase [Berryella intestinalis]|uniref:M20/M25/M40 family metallo-hydrolase n=1 Tax=Berryella intestinalis TaxID=1531429 RepID=UPI002A74B741|nr:M20/M25/M40 family metallo-hydrolase [Berryella intestinalis]MDY3129500.1 M20/M25/M40 family metallo-hydrolase [Berryella intestinalis]